MRQTSFSQLVRLKHLVSALRAVNSICFSVSSMANSQQEQLRSAWLVGKEGCLPGREQAKAWALREVWRESGKTDYGMHAYIAGKLTKQGGDSPERGAVRKFFDKIDADDDWFPGKGNYENMGRPAVMTGQQRAAIARCAMTMKKAGVEPTYPRVIAACPNAGVNPETDRPWSKDTVYTIMGEDCYDDDPFLPWVCKARYSKKAVTTAMKNPPPSLKCRVALDRQGPAGELLGQCHPNGGTFGRWPCR